MTEKCTKYRVLRSAASLQKSINRQVQLVKFFFTEIVALAGEGMLWLVLAGVEPFLQEQVRHSLV